MKYIAESDRKGFQAFVALLIVSLGLSACTKPRDAKLSDEVVEAELMPISELQKDGYRMELGADAQAFDFNGKPVAVNEKPSFPVRTVSVPSKISGLVKKARVQGKAGQTVALRFKVDAKKIFGLKKVESPAELTLLEKDLVETIQGAPYLPIFTIPVKRAGVVVHIKNDRGEKTHKQELRETDISRATHVQLDLRDEEFRMVEIPRDVEGMNLRKEIFLAKELHDRAGTLAEINDLLQNQIKFDKPSEHAVVRLQKDADAASAKVNVLVYSVRRKAEITDEKLLAKLKAGIENAEIVHCPTQVRHQLKLEPDDCILVLESKLTGSAIATKMQVDSDGRPTGSVTTEEVPASKRMALIRIGRNTPAVPAGPGALRQLNPINTIQLSDIRGKEFLFRRTFEDAASSLSAFGPGASGPLEIVRIALEDDRIVVRRADPINAERKAQDIDKEELMSIPVRYLKVRDTDGSLLSEFRPATKDTADVAILDWTQNTLPVVSSPLAYFDAGQCFVQTGHQNVEDMDMRLNQGILNFSISGTYAFRPECMTYFGLSDYWFHANIQSNFNLRERISFKLHDSSRDKMANQDLPFKAQTLMGFGYFTTNKRVPDRFGNFGRTGNEVAMPAIQDFSNGKVLTYILGGLPADEKLRKVFIDTTREVIADWNENLKRAFKDTPLERPGIYIDLKIDGVDVPAGRLGDLDRNYIWNFDKSLDSGLLGMAQPAPNPRTGVAEANNVLMYSGNVLSYIGSERRAALIRRQYAQLKREAEKTIQAEFEQELKESQAQREIRSGTVEGKAGEAQQLIRRLSEKSMERSFPRTPVALTNPQNMKRVADKLMSIRTRGEDLTERKEQALRSFTTEKAYLRKIVENALRMNATKDESMLAALSAAEILKAYGPRLSREEQQALAFQSRRLALKAEFEKGFKSRNGCIISAEGIATMGPDSLVDEPLEKVFSNWYAKTLSHEIGHSLGLTHNFKGSFDKRNFAFGDDRKDKDRTYSSIMDYPSGTTTNYQKPGPYDMHALRAGYAGMLEVADNVKAAARDQGGKKVIAVRNPEGQPVVIELVGGKFVRIEDLKNAVVPARPDDDGKMVKSWWNADAQMLSRIPLKGYHFCTDIHVGMEPTCNRWDAGTTPLEIVKFYINEYNGMYPVLNSRGDRINAVGMGSYLGRIFMNYFAIRSFLDETFFRAISGYPDVGEYVPAAVEGYKFFLNVFNTPHANARVMDPKRFHRVDYKKNVPKVGADGKPVVGADGEPVFDEVDAVAIVEARATRDLLEPGFDDAIHTRGIEFDKAFALMMLTQRSVGNYRYERIGLRLSYAEFEKFVLQMQPAQSFIMRSLRSTLADNMTTMMFTDDGLVNAPAGLVPDTSDLIRYFTVMSSAVYLEADTLEDKDNFAALFRVGSSLHQPPSDRIVVTKADQNPSSPGALKFYAFDNADMAGDLVREAAQKRLLIEKGDEIGEAVVKVVMAPNPDEQKKALDAAAEVMGKLNKNGILLNEIEAKQGITFQAQVVFMIRHMQQMLGLAASIVDQAKQQGIPEEAIPQAAAEILAPIAQSNVINAKNLPLIMVAGKIMKKQTEKVPVMRALVEQITVNEDSMKTNLGIITNNLQTLNKIVTILNPELNR